MAGIRERGPAGLSVPRDGCAGDGRRHGPGFPRRRARSGDRPSRAGCRVALAGRRAGAHRRYRTDPAARRRPDGLARCVHQPRCEGRTQHWARRSKRFGAPGRCTGSALERSPTRESPRSAAALGPQLCTSLGPREAIRLRAAALVGRLPVRPIHGCVCTGACGARPGAPCRRALSHRRAPARSARARMDRQRRRRNGSAARLRR